MHANYKSDEANSKTKNINMVLLYFTYTVLYPFSMDPYDKVKLIIINNTYHHKPYKIF